MADEIMEAIQMLRFGYDGIKLGLDVTGSSIREAKNLTIFIVGLLNHEKTQGKTSLKKMLKNSGNLQVLQIKEKDVKEFEKLAGKYGILYSKMPDINKGDGMKEFVFPVEATPRINALIEKLGNGKLEDIAEYVRNGDGNCKNTMDYLKKKKLLPEAPVSVTAERKKEIVNAEKNIKYNENINDLEKTDITISKNLVESEKRDLFITRVPGTFGENVKYLTIKKDDIITINGGKTFLTFLNKNQEYKVNVDNGYNIIRIKDKKAKIKESDCSNQTCVNMGTISKDGQTLICLPHKVEVTIVSDDKSEVDVIAR